MLTDSYQTFHVRNKTKQKKKKKEKNEKRKTKKEVHTTRKVS